MRGAGCSRIPMEACDLVGGEACEAAEMYPETKLGGSSAVDVAGSGSRVREGGGGAGVPVLRRA
jgi:hypothetical protein